MTRGRSHDTPSRRVHRYRDLRMVLPLPGSIPPEGDPGVRVVSQPLVVSLHVHRLGTADPGGLPAGREPHFSYAAYEPDGMGLGTAAHSSGSHDRGAPKASGSASVRGRPVETTPRGQMTKGKALLASNPRKMGRAANNRMHAAQCSRG